jgi:MFS family permease
MGEVVPHAAGGRAETGAALGAREGARAPAASLEVALFSVLTATTGLPLPLLMVLLGARSLVETPGITARVSLLPDLTARAGTRRETANTLFQTAQRLGLAVGTPCAALFVTLTGPVRALCADAVTFVASAVLIALGVPRAADGTGRRPENGFLKDLVDGWTFIRSTPVMAGLATTVVGTNFADNALSPVVFPGYGREIPGNAELVAWLVGANGVGATIGTFLYAALADRRVTFLGCFGLVLAMRAVMVALPGLVPMIQVAFAIGLASGPLNPIITTVVQDAVPERLRGRAFGAFSTMAYAAAPFGTLLTGWLIPAAGMRAALDVFTALYALVLLYALVSPAPHGLNDRAESRPSPAYK